MKVVWSDLALARAEEMYDYIATDSHPAAKRWLEGLLASVERLELFPGSGRRVPELRRTDLREVFYQNCRVIYRIKEEQVQILTVRHMRQQLSRADLGA